jgi:hypothetical protein
MGALISGFTYQGIDERFPMIFGIAGTFCLVAFAYLMMRNTPKHA